MSKFRQIPRNFERPRLFGGWLLLLALLLAGCREDLHYPAKRAENVEKDLTALQNSFPALSGLLTCQDAVRLAIKHNYERHVARMELVAQLKARDAARWKMLPDLDFNSDFTQESDIRAYSSVNLETGRRSLPTSYSSSQSKTIFDLKAALDVLDLGIHYMRSRVATRQGEHALEDIRRVEQRIALEVSEAYWEAVAAEELWRAAQEILAEIEQAINWQEKNRQEGAISYLELLARKMPLLKKRASLESLRLAAQEKRLQLLNQLGAPALVEGFALSRLTDVTLREHALQSTALEEIALLERAELRQFDIDELNNVDEARIAIAEMFPSFNLLYKGTASTDPLVEPQNWRTFGFGAAWRIFTIPQQIADWKKIKTQGEIKRLQRVSLTAGVISQVNLALIVYEKAKDDYGNQGEIADVAAKIFTLAKGNFTDGAINQMEYLDNKFKMLESYRNYVRATSEVMKALMRLTHAVGINPEALRPQHLAAMPYLADLGFGQIAQTSPAKENAPIERDAPDPATAAITNTASAAPAGIFLPTAPPQKTALPPIAATNAAAPLKKNASAVVPATPAPAPLQDLPPAAATAKELKPPARHTAAPPPPLPQKKPAEFLTLEENELAAAPSGSFFVVAAPAMPAAKKLPPPPRRAAPNLLPPPLPPQNGPALLEQLALADKALVVLPRQILTRQIAAAALRGDNEQPKTIWPLQTEVSIPVRPKIYQPVAKKSRSPVAAAAALLRTTRREPKQAAGAAAISLSSAAKKSGKKLAAGSFLDMSIYD